METNQGKKEQPMWIRAAANAVMAQWTDRCLTFNVKNIGEIIARHAPVSAPVPSGMNKCPRCTHARHAELCDEIVNTLDGTGGLTTCGCVAAPVPQTTKREHSCIDPGMCGICQAAPVPEPEPDLCCQAKYRKHCGGVCTCKICAPDLHEIEAALEAEDEARKDELGTPRELIIQILKNCAADFCQPQKRNPENPQWRVDCAIANGVTILENSPLFAPVAPQASPEPPAKEPTIEQAREWRTTQRHLNVWKGYVGVTVFTIHAEELDQLLVDFARARLGLSGRAE